ncbi:MAG: T9SS type A sorting domain-containing protein [Ignavibacteria bacterium]|nr:T9SS type A sorting domain-containing protein [Ignavibacteria bacterium]
MKKILFLLIVSAASVYSQLAPEWVNTYGLNTHVIKILRDNNNDFIYLSRSLADSMQGTTSFFEVNKINAAGTLLWNVGYTGFGPDSGDSPRTMCIDNQNNIYVLEGKRSLYTNTDFGVIKYSPNGDFLWEYFYTSPGGYNSYDDPHAITVDNSGNCYVTGSSVYNMYRDSILTIKLNSSGTLQWKRTYARKSYTYLTTGECLYADNQSNIYVGGTVNDSANGFLNAVLLKYSPSGDLLWTAGYNGTPGNMDIYYDIKPAPDGNLVLCGAADAWYNADTSSMLLQKITTGGNTLWTQVLNTMNPGGEDGCKLLIDNSNNIFVLGRSNYEYYNQNYASAIFLLKYNSAGNLLWDKRHGDYYSARSFAFEMVFDNNNDIMISGYQQKYGRTNLMILKYGGVSGNNIWTYLYNRTGSSLDISYLTSQLPDGRIITTGTSGGLPVMMKMQPTNAFTQTFRRTNLYKPILDSQLTYDTILFNTDILPPEAYLHFISIKIDTLLHTAAGDLEISLINSGKTDTIFFRRGANLDNLIGTNICDTSTQSICNYGLPPFTGYFAPCKPISGRYLLPGSGPWILRIYDRKAPETGVLKAWSLTLSYESLIGLLQVSTEIPERFSLSQNYPNPFNPVTRIRFSISNAADVKLQIFDILGKEVKVLVNDSFTPGVYEADFDASTLPSGVYFYKLTSGTFSESKKMVLLK